MEGMVFKLRRVAAQAKQGPGRMEELTMGQASTLARNEAHIDKTNEELEDLEEARALSRIPWILETRNSCCSWSPVSK